MPASLNVPQAKFLALPHKFRAYVAGFGSGKTWVGSAAICKHVWEWPKVNCGYFAPTYGDIRDTFYPTMEEVAFDWGLRTVTREANKEVHFYRGRQYRGTTICRSMDDPANIKGFKIGRALVDELDTLKMEKAKLAWRKIVARMRLTRSGLLNQIDVATTPEGFRFVYEQWVKAIRDKPSLGDMYGLVQASTYDNEANLPDDYIASLMATYPPQLIEAYLNGQFVNLTSGTIYHAFSRKANACDDVMQDGEPVYVGMDFNVGKMAAVIHVKRDGLPRAVGEVVNAYDTPDMVRILQERLGERQVRVYPDASGGSRRSVDASLTDIRILKDAK